MKRVGIVAHSAEGGALCYISTCREGQSVLGPHRHPEIVLSSIPMALSMPGWESGDLKEVAVHLRKGVQQVADAGADFYICPDNTAHIVLEEIAEKLPIPGLHIAEVVAFEMKSSGWATAGLLGTKWTMAGNVYRRALQKCDLVVQTPVAKRQEQINSAIFEELCQGVFQPATTEIFVDTISELRQSGADCVILGCTEIPLIISDLNSPLPVLDSTRLLAKYAVREACTSQQSASEGGWISVEPLGILGGHEASGRAGPIGNGPN